MTETILVPVEPTPEVLRAFIDAAEQMITHESNGGAGWWRGYDALKTAFIQTGAPCSAPWLHEKATPEGLRCEECKGKGWTRAYSRNEYESDECPVCKGDGYLQAAPKPTIPGDDREEVADFDQACDDFAHWLKVGADWKNSYYGASYKTRLRHAIQDIRIACDQMEAAIAKDFPTPSEGGRK